MLLVAEGLRVVLGNQDVLRDVDVSLEKGKILGILGPSGAGKTTLFRALAGEIVPSHGTVRVNGVDVSRLALWKRARAGLGYLPQTPSVLLDLTVRDNIRTFEDAARVPKLPVEARAREVELEARLGVRASALSGGERRRLELLRALIADPVVLLCDEPFAAGDPTHVRLLATLLRAHADKGRAVLVADHRVGDALSICDEGLLLADGRVCARVPAAEFADHPAVRGRYLGQAN